MSNSTQNNDNDLPFNYVPTESVAILFVVLFGITGFIHLVQAFYYRAWYFVPTVVFSALGELIGWSGRLWGSLNPYNLTAFLMQIASLIMSPSFMTAAIFCLLPPIISRLGTQYSRFSRKYYNFVFVTADCLALILQAVGGGIASSADDDATGNLGGHIALAGIVIQLVTLLIFAVCASEVIFRFYHDRPYHKEMNYSDEKQAHDGSSSPASSSDSTHFLASKHRTRNLRQSDRPLFLLIISVFIVITLVLIRSFYRTVELSYGWSGPIISTQWLFDAFDGAPIFLALLTLNVLHPARLLRLTPLAKSKKQTIEFDSQLHPRPIIPV